MSRNGLHDQLSRFLWNLPPFMIGGEMFALLLEQAEIFQRIAVDQQQVGQGAGLQRAQFALLPNDPRADRLWLRE